MEVKIYLEDGTIEEYENVGTLGRNEGTGFLWLRWSGDFGHQVFYRPDTVRKIVIDEDE